MNYSYVISSNGTGCRLDSKKEYMNNILKKTTEIQTELATIYTIINPQDNLTNFKNIALTRFHIKRIKEMADLVEFAVEKLEEELIRGGEK